MKLIGYIKIIVLIEFVVVFIFFEVIYMYVILNIKGFKFYIFYLLYYGILINDLICRFFVRFCFFICCNLDINKKNFLI